MSLKRKWHLHFHKINHLKSQSNQNSLWARKHNRIWKSLVFSLSLSFWLLQKNKTLEFGTQFFIFFSFCTSSIWKKTKTTTIRMHSECHNRLINLVSGIWGRNYVVSLQRIHDGTQWVNAISIQWKVARFKYNVAVIKVAGGNFERTSGT